ncbi:hypothetical protein BDV95DRAFT_479233 [Massariosphaeria phaeospora]|uniref:DUF1640-domain-containing protein n=1 Tax=Massariosphaeria phaeospora TaxID=100035 RepID=A0A7C8IRW8_9PLEO|nr:hypothetical protein BDV95DRAFT_479233 [Massariosphaeria phaeospora]
MSAPRLPFLWPMLFRPLKTPHVTSRVPPQNAPARRNLAVTPRHAQAPLTQRYGTAHELSQHLPGQEIQKDGKTETDSTPEEGVSEPVDQPTDEAPSASIPSLLSKAQEVLETPITPAPEPPKLPEEEPMETVLHMPSPQEEEQRKPPHLITPPYVHHFDTYGLVKGLAKSGFTPDQSITIMKGLRSVLTDNMKLARDGLVSKSNVENGTYLFRAACSELRTELTNNRQGELERMRSERTQLQHEVDILSQRVGQESGHLKDELKGLFDDRKMAVRQEQRAMETKIQELNYKITVALNSDARSEVEGVRWVLTRRAAITIGISAFMLFLSLRYSSYLSHLQAEEDKKKAQQRRRPPPDQDLNNSGGGGPNPMANGEASRGELLSATGGVSLG